MIGNHIYEKERVRFTRHGNISEETIFSSQKVLELGVQLRLGGQSADVNAAQEDGECQAIDVQHSAGNAAVHHLEQVRSDDGQALSVIAHFFQARIVVEYRVEDVEEEVQRVLVQEVHLAERIEREVDVAARLRQRHVLLRYRFDLADHLVRLLDLLADFRRLPLQRLQRRDDRVIVQDLTLGVIQRLQQRFFKLPESQVILSCSK